jgi:hypothetical protein
MPVIPHYPGDVWAGEVLLDPNTLERKGLFTFRTETIERGLVPPPAMRSARTEARSQGRSRDDGSAAA